MRFVEFLIKVERFHEATCHEFNNARVGVRGTGTSSVCRFFDATPTVSQRDDHARSQVPLTLTMTCTTYNDYRYKEKLEGGELSIVYPEWDHVNNEFTDETNSRGPRRRPKRIEWRSDASPRAS